MLTMIAPTEAQRIILDNTKVLGTQTIAHADALGRVLAADIISEIELPPFANSAMDGYAVIAADTHGASPAKPSTLRLLETVAAGEVGSHSVQRGACTKIMTGGKIPAGADAVVMREETREENGQVQIFAEAKPQQNIRPAGDDVKRGERVLERGTTIRPAEWAMLASLGQAHVEVFRQPRVSIIATGKELVDVDAKLEDGQIRDSNSFALEGLCRQAGAIVERVRVGDELEEVRAALREYSARCDCIVTSGGVSAGDFDPVRDVLFATQESREAQIHFWKIAMKPGKPVMFATLGNGKRETENGIPLFGLPGNPVSVMVAWEQFVRPALLKMQGRAQMQRLTVEAEVRSSFKSPEGRVEFVRGFVTREEGKWIANLSGDQGSGRFSTMTRANALLIVPAETTRVEAGSTLRAELLDT
jgi:molybdopterin molybdotransferase